VTVQWMLAGGALLAAFGLVIGVLLEKRRHDGEHCRDIHQLQTVLDQTVRYVYGGTFGVMPAETAQFVKEMKDAEEQELEGA
jgi:hypothetical protein